MKRSVLHLCLSVLVCLACWCLSACSLMHEDLQPCEYRLHFVYDYNMKFVDAYTREVEQITLFVFDQDGKYVTHVDLEGEDARRNQILLPLPAGTYQLLAWGGLKGESYLNPVSNGTENIEDYTAQIDLTKTQGVSSTNLASLFYGRMTVTLPADAPADIAMPLVKDTNIFRFVVQIADGSILSPDAFEFEITDTNAHLNAGNLPTAQTPVRYQPYLQTSGEVYDKEGNVVQTAACAELSTNRLMADSDATLCIRHKGTGKVWLETSLIDYLMLTAVEGDLALMEDQANREQEYLDRQDRYVMIFFFQYSEEKQAYINVAVNINGWTVRFNNIEM